MNQGIFLQGLTLGELEALIRKLIAEGIEVAQKKEQNSAQKKEEKYLSRFEVANKLNLSLPTLLKYSKEGLIPVRRIGARVLYLESDVHEALELVKSSKFKKR